MYNLIKIKCIALALDLSHAIAGIYVCAIDIIFFHIIKRVFVSYASCSSCIIAALVASILAAAFHATRPTTVLGGCLKIVKVFGTKPLFTSATSLPIFIKLIKHFIVMRDEFMRIALVQVYTITIAFWLIA